MLILTIVCFAACMLSIARIRFTVSTTDVSEEIYAGKVVFFATQSATSIWWMGGKHWNKGSHPISHPISHPTSHPTAIRQQTDSVMLITAILVLHTGK